MELKDAVNLIAGAVPNMDSPQVWADLGCGSGLFTQALCGILPQRSTIYAIDRLPQSMGFNNDNIVSIDFRQADFIMDDLQLKGLNGILMANSLHFAADKKSLIKKLSNYLSPHGLFVVVEYDTLQSSPWVPFPINIEKLTQLFMDAGFNQVKRLGERPSVFRRAKIYSCQASRDSG